MDDNAYATVNSTSGVVTVSSLPEYDITLTLTVTTTATGGTPAAPANTTLTASKEITIQGTKPSAPTITVNGTNVTLATTAAGSTTIRYTLDGTEPTASTGTVYSGAIDLSGSTTSPVTIKAVTVRNGNASEVSEQTVTLTLPEPTITISGEAQTATITSSVAGATIYYTTDGSTPTTSSSQYSGTLTGLAYMTTVKAIAVKDGWNNSPVASGIVTIPSGVSGGVVTLFDYEPHSWSYYSDATLPEMMRSLNPADVKITYYGDGIVMTGNNDYTASSTDFVQPGNGNYVGGAKVNVGGEDENTFVYYKTLERTDGSTSDNPTGRCAYTTIPNPFQVRPTYGNRTVNGVTTDADNFTGWRGFQCWRLKSVSGGSVYSAASGGTALATGAIINGETQIYFAPTSEYGMDVQLEAVWARAYVKKGNSSGANNILSQNVGVERNFMILTAGQNYRFDGTSGRYIGNKGYAVTISNYYPSGEAPDNTSSTISGYDDMTLGADTKFENVTFNSMGSYTLTAAGHDLIVGRGCTGTVNNLYGLNAASTSSFKMRIESGTYNNLYFLGQGRNFTNDAKLTTIMGSDYDRAKVCGGDASYNEKLRVTADIGLGYNSTAGNTNNKGAEIFHCTVKSGNFDLGTAKYAGSEQFYISVWGNDPRTYGKRTLIVEGGIFSDIAGGMEQSTATQNVLMVDMRIKGGTVNSVVYGAAQRSGALGHRRMIITGGLIKGWIAGGANGNSNAANSTGEMTGNTYIYVGGNTEVNSNNSTTVLNRATGGNVFAAGCGWSSTTNSGLVTGNTNVAIADNAYVERGVYGGGSYGYTTQTSNIYILGGTIDCKAGGVNGTTYNANVNGGVYGGACQNRAGVTNVKVYGGTVNGGVYGGGNVSGDVAGPITVDVYGTDPAPSANTYAINQVFGGGNQAAFNGTPTVTVHCGADATTPISIEEVYGGGNAATVTGTNVTIEGGNTIGNVFGGCYGANVTTNGTKVNVKGGTIGKVFGGNNQSGSITGAIKVRVDKQSTCPMKIGELYGGGNVAASAVGSIDIGCTGDLTAAHATCNETDNRIGYELEGIGDVYGGANAAAVTGNVTLTIDSGMVYRVFGNNNTSASVSGTITVNIDKQNDACGWYVGHVYGGGNKAPYTAPNATPNHPAVNIKNGKVSYNVFGGGLGTTAAVSGNPQVILSGTAEVGGNVYGGGNAAPVSGNTKVTLRD